MPTDNGRITSHFGNRADPFTRATSFHSGIDIAAPLNTPIYATADGIIISVGWEGGYGRTIVIEHGDTYETLYAHLNEIYISVGDEVEKGDLIGGMGTTGRSTGVHLHYEIRRNGSLVDPYPYMTFHESQGD
nr:M23 family metallopeptidase [Evansella tamaricis]